MFCPDVYKRQPLTEEIESVEWMPGVIVLLSESQVEEIKNTGMILKNIPVFQINLPSVSNQSSQCFNEYLQEAEKKGEALFPYLFYPFDFTSKMCIRDSIPSENTTGPATTRLPSSP